VADLGGGMSACCITDSVTVDCCSLQRTLVMDGHIIIVHCCQRVKGKGNCIATNGSIPWHSYGVSLAIWDHTVLPATRHK